MSARLHLYLRILLNENVNTNERERLTSDRIINGKPFIKTAGLIRTILAATNKDSKVARLLLEANQLKKKEEEERAQVAEKVALRSEYSATVGLTWAHFRVLL